MPIRYEKMLTVDLCRLNPHALVVFGDNLERRGKGGQAIIRDEPNALGIPTKRRPSWDEDAFFTDADLDLFREALRPAYVLLVSHLKSRGTVIWPADGIGTGRAQLVQRAPLLWAGLQATLEHLEVVAWRLNPLPHDS